MKQLTQLENNFEKQGWIVISLPDPNPVHQTRMALQNELRRLTKNPQITLENYHQIVGNDQKHTQLQIQLTDFFRRQRFAYQIISAQLSFFKTFIGQDLKVQRNPYLRITRPQKPQDNIGYHRDTFYGGSPFELSVLIPYVDVSAESALSILSGSHIRPESEFSTVQIPNPDPAVTKGSAKHQLGFLYAPKQMDFQQLKGIEPIPLKLGEALIFSLSSVHGSLENRGKFSRWSSDIRIMNGLAPVDLSLRPDYYETLSDSVVTRQANRYHQAQTAQKSVV